jgi:hypothetical protein
MPGEMRRLVGSVAPVLPVLLLALTLRAAFLGDQQLFRDEATSWLLANRPPWDVVAAGVHETFPPLYPLLLSAWMAIFGSSEAALRSLSVVAGLGTVSVTWLWGWKAFSARAGLLAAIVVAVSPASVMMDRNARMYALEAFFSTSAWCLIWATISGRAGASARTRGALMAALAAAVAGEVWAMATGLPTAAIQLTVVAGATLWARRNAWPARDAGLALAAVLIGAVSLVVWLPYLLPVASGSSPFWTPRPGLSEVGTTVESWQVSSDLGFLARFLAVAGTALAVYGLVSTWHRAGAGMRDPATRPSALRARAFVVVLGGGFCLVPALWIYSQFRSVYDARYLAGLVPIFGLAFAVGAADAGGLAGRLVGNRARRASRLGVSALLVMAVGGMLAASCLGIDSAHADEDRDPGRQAAVTLQREVRSGDVVVALDARSYFPLRYYLDRDGWLGESGVRLVEWHRPGEAFYAGWQDIEPSDRLEEAELERLGWEDALRLPPSATIWLASIVDPAKDFGGLPEETRASLEIVRTIDVAGSGRSGRIQAAIPAARTAARPELGALGGPLATVSPHKKRPKEPRFRIVRPIRESVESFG